MKKTPIRGASINIINKNEKFELQLPLSQFDFGIRRPENMCILKGPAPSRKQLSSAPVKSSQPKGPVNAISYKLLHQTINLIWLALSSHYAQNWKHLPTYHSVDEGVEIVSDIEYGHIPSRLNWFRQYDNKNKALDNAGCHSHGPINFSADRKCRTSWFFWGSWTTMSTYSR